MKKYLLLIVVSLLLLNIFTFVKLQKLENLVYSWTVDYKGETYISAKKVIMEE